MSAFWLRRSRGRRRPGRGAASTGLTELATLAGRGACARLRVLQPSPRRRPRAPPPPRVVTAQPSPRCRWKGKRPTSSHCPPTAQHGGSPWTRGAAGVRASATAARQPAVLVSWPRRTPDGHAASIHPPEEQSLVIEHAGVPDGHKCMNTAGHVRRPTRPPGHLSAHAASAPNVSAARRPRLAVRPA